jgi:hypothetical protein
MQTTTQPNQQLNDSDRPALGIWRNLDGEWHLFAECDFPAGSDTAEQTVRNILNSGSMIAPLNEAGRQLVMTATNHLLPAA